MTLDPTPSPPFGLTEHGIGLYRYGSAVLAAAIGGTLSSDWREDLAAEHAAQPAELREAWATAAATLIALPRQLWEPEAAGGDWLAALDAWLETSSQLAALYAALHPAGAAWNGRQDADQRAAQFRRARRGWGIPAYWGTPHRLGTV